MTIEQARQIVAEYIAGWSTEKLMEAEAFCADGKMDASNACECIVGVGSSSHPHVAEMCPGAGHYVRSGLHGSSIEKAYFDLGDRNAVHPLFTIRATKLERDTEFLAILRAELERREPVAINMEAVELEVPA